jgi:PAS domain S-box-containing protein
MNAPTPDELHDVILDSIADGVFTVDEQFRITSFNRAAERITGVPCEEAIGKPCREVFRASVCDDGCALRETCDTGQPIVDKPLHILARDGRRVPISISTAVLKDRDGRMIGGVETFRDLSMVEQLRKELKAKEMFAGIIGRSPAMRRLFRVLPQFAESPSTVLIEGSSGTGKELFARAMHHLSSRRNEPFVAVNCGALPDTLLESELFGYKAGAFTDARNDKPGRFALANGGTIFLDEIGDVSSAMQTKLLRVLQERVVEPLGSVESTKVDVRVITATNQDLGALVRAGTFREDLYYRINIVRLELPSLKERREDIPLLIDHFIAKFNRLQGKRVATVSDDVASILMAHDYPGNVRELENIIEYAFVLCRGGVIESRHLPPALQRCGHGAIGGSGREFTLKDLELYHIVEALRRHDGNRTAAARDLGINPSTLFRKIKALDIQVPAADGRHRKVRAADS